MKLIPKRIFVVAGAIITLLMFAIIYLQFFPIEFERISLRELLMILTVILGVVFATFYFLIEYANQPIDKIVNVIDQLTQSQYHVRYYGSKYSDFDELGGKVNTLAQKLESKTQQLYLHDERLEALVDHLVIGVLSLNASRVIELTNQTAHHFFLESKQLKGKNYMEVVHNYELAEMIEKAYEEQQAVHQEIYLYYPLDLIVDVHIIPTFTTDHQLDQVLVLLYDLTKIKRLEQVRTDFVANASHELRTPITAIQGFCETLLDGAMEVPALRERFLSIIHKESTRLNQLIGDILQLSKLEQKTVQQDSELIDLVAITQSMIELLSEQLQQKQLTIRLESPDELFLMEVQQRLEQILMNLLGNAINYTEVGDQITVHLSQANGLVNLEVSDTGIGIPEKEIDRVFERFYRVDKVRSRNTGGTGLGLAIVKNLVLSMDGTISVKSQLGIGTTFTIVFPMQNQ